MSDELGTDLERDSVADPVADDDDLDPDALRTALAEERAKRKELESHIGRQNDVHGKRIKELQERFDRKEQEERERREKAAEAAWNAKLAALSPAQQAVEISKKTEAELRRIREEQEQSVLREQERGVIAGILREAEAAGIDTSQIDQSSQENALLTYYSLKEQKRDQELAELKAELKRRQEEQTEELVETLAVTTGRRRVASGSPTPSTKEKVDPQILELRQQIAQARRVGDRAKAMDLLFKLKRLEE